MRIVIIDEDTLASVTTAKLLTNAGHDAICFETLKEGLQREQDFDAILVGMPWPCSAALGILQDIKSHNPDALALLMSAHWNHPTREEALRRGAHAVLEKPFGLDNLEVILNARQRVKLSE